MTYLKTKLLANPLDPIVKVESPSKKTVGYPQAISEWIDAVLEARKLENVKLEGKEALDKLMRRIRKQCDSFEAAINADGKVSTAEEQALSEDRDGDSDDEEELLLKAEKLFIDPPLWHPPAPPAPVAAPSASSSRRKSGAPVQPAAQHNLSEDPINPMNLPLSVYLQELASRLARFFEQAFESSIRRSEITSVQKVITWSPPDREEDDAITALGLARDPTKITSRVVVSADEEDGPSKARHWIACETPAGILGSDEPAVCKSFLRFPVRLIG